MHINEKILAITLGIIIALLLIIGVVLMVYMVSEFGWEEVFKRIDRVCGRRDLK